MDLYIIFALLYAVIIGVYNVFRKKAVEKSSESTILFLFNGVAFLCSLIWLPFGVAIPSEFVWIFVLKGFLLTLNWYIVLKVLRDADVSLVSLTTIISSVLTLSIGVFGFGESATILQFAGAVIVIIGAFLINLINKNATGKVNIAQIGLLLVSAIISSVSNIIDKYTTTHLESHQVQFWFLLFTFVFSTIFFIIECVKSKKFLLQKTDFKNFWIYLVGIGLFVADMFLFLAYKMPGSQMIIITSITKFKVVVTVILGVFVFKEKNILKKVLISLLMFAGILMLSL